MRIPFVAKSLYLSTLTVASIASSRFHGATRCMPERCGGAVMEALTGTIKSYSRKTGEGLIALDGEDEPVRVDLLSSAGVWLKNGLHMQLSRIQRPKGVYAFNIKLISRCP
jgi:CspA family cold shock protein